MSLAAVADRYARAVYELGRESNQLSQISDQIAKVARVYEDSVDLRAVLDNPLVEEEKREAILQAVGSRLGLGPVVINTLRLLAKRSRLVVLPELARRLGKLSDEQAGIIRATVTSATDLPASWYEKLSAALQKQTGKKVVLSKHTDPSLIAGVVTRIGDNTIDGSVKGRLDDLERKLLQAS